MPASTVDARPNFQMVIYPGWLSGKEGKADAPVQPTAQTPPSFIVQAENDYTAHVENALIYFQALKDAKSCRVAPLHAGRPWVRASSDGPAHLALAGAG